jgi:hypothetical protein
VPLSTAAAQALMNSGRLKLDYAPKETIGTRQPTLFSLILPDLFPSDRLRIVFVLDPILKCLEPSLRMHALCT